MSERVSDACVRRAGPVRAPRGLRSADRTSRIDRDFSLSVAAPLPVPIDLFGPHPIVDVGTPAPKARWLPRLVQRQEPVAFGVTEPDAALSTTAI